MGFDIKNSKTITVTGTTDSNGFLPTGLLMNNCIPLSAVSLRVEGTAKYSYFYNFLAWGGDPATQYAIQVRNWNGDILNGTFEIVIRYLQY